MLTDGKHLNILWSWPVWWTVWNHCFPLFSHHFIRSSLQAQNSCFPQILSIIVC